MDDTSTNHRQPTSTTTATLDQADEDILTDTVSDEALEAAAGTERGRPVWLPSDTSTLGWKRCC